MRASIFVASNRTDRNHYAHLSSLHYTKLAAPLVSAVNRTDLNVRESHCSVATLGDHIVRNTAVCGAGAASNARLALVSILGVSTIPREKASPMAERPPRLSNEVGSPKASFWALQKSSIRLISVSSPVSEGIDDLSVAVEGFVAHAEGVEVAAVFIADAVVASVANTAGRVRFASRLAVLLADVRDPIEPVPELGSPSLGVQPSTLACKHRELRELGQPTNQYPSWSPQVSLLFILLSCARTYHFDKVQSSIHTTWQARDIDVESKFLVPQIEHLIVLTTFAQKVNTRADHHLRRSSERRSRLIHTG
ncbi:putative 1,4-beta-D-glucan cellobiohydrolase [Hortaea werneckii]|nr:putative 1,4-beta-D-glucan cellobiohydrolase [Hortaea werneckii]